VTIDQAHKHTRIRTRYLQAVEEENWSAFTSRVYIEGVIRSYALFLGLEPEKAMAYFRRDYERVDDLAFKKKLPSLQLLPETKKLLIVSISIVCVFFLLYFGYQILQYLAPPYITILEPQKKIVRNVEKITVVGKTKPESTIRIQGEEFFPDKEGIFRYSFPLTKGVNTLRIEVVGANGKESVVYDEILLE